MPSARRRKLLSHSRPKLAQEQGPNWSSQKTRSVIRSHHQLQKKLAQARAAKDDSLADELKAQIDGSGGLSAYQRASTLGQARDRGGDTSKLLVEWLTEARAGTAADGVTNAAPSPVSKPLGRYRLLEIGCLKVDNACARSGLFDMKRIDLRSQHPDIEEQDFMKLHPPESASLSTEGYDLISLSLVLNYVSGPAERGEMLKHAAKFLRNTTPAVANGSLGGLLPGIFIVLPVACVTNSRYLDESKLVEIMSALGYDLERKKYSPKLVYLSWRKTHSPSSHAKIGKQEIVSGRSLNNFAIVLD